MVLVEQDGDWNGVWCALLGRGWDGMIVDDKTMPAFLDMSPSAPAAFEGAQRLVS